MIRDQYKETVVGAPPEGWTLGHVTLSLCYPTEKAPVEAWRRGAFAVHELADGSGRLTHAPSGLQIQSFDTMDSAVEMAERIEPLADWGAITEQLAAGTDLYPKVRKIADEIKSGAL